ncbi:winged helix DNA-binding domain-containing protein [Roseisolibacter sp. H3M3-2]|uniref:winged helix DNA-binding domain-containing protein n=1 Tax=Roseisolibacter sp. H3M3-2 TaxID=3031323 RepID=UPI0023D979C7|nr:winged helix DNA-binding domain-containing protein [Roseisolibacter sp. H3M3-2]MDF1503854.1 winged helix DNA-binding domain-containing protein [Roseisolibacter sp. H3M3-2]
MPAPTLSRLDLSRATLARQHLLARTAAPVARVVHDLAGMQAQLARPPFVGLWTRIDGLARDALPRAAHDRAVVRATAMRGTLHLLTADDYRAWRGPLAGMLAAAGASIVGGRSDGPDPAAARAAALGLLRAEGAMPFDALRERLAARFPGADVRAMGYTVRMHLPLVQLPAEGAAWGWDAKAPFGPAEDWLRDPSLGDPTAADPDPAPLVRRYLAAYGPASVADAQTWSGLKGLRATFAALRDELATFRDERGRELFDLPDAPRPGGDAAAPVRYLPEFDQLVLAHDDRSRVIDEAHRPLVFSKNLMVAATFLVDGRVAGTWGVAVKRGTAALAVRPFAALSRRVRGELEAEGEALVRFVEPAARGWTVEFVM